MKLTLAKFRAFEGVCHIYGSPAKIRESRRRGECGDADNVLVYMMRTRSVKETSFILHKNALYSGWRIREMLGRMLGKIVVVIVFLIIAAVVPVSVWQRHRTLGEIGIVSQRFVVSATKLDLVRLRDCITTDGREMLPPYYACIARKKLSELNRGVRITVRTKVIKAIISDGEATVRIKREVFESGMRLDKPVKHRFTDQCTVICLYDGKRWLVDLERTLKNDQFPATNISLFKECLPK